MAGADIMTTDVITLGCRLNAFESEVMRANAARAGLADAVIVNTCAVTAEAERQARQAIRRARRDRPGAKVIVTGCAAQLDPAKYAAMPEVDRVLGNEEKLDLASYQSLGHADTPAVQVADIMAVKETAPHLIDGFDGRARAFIQVQQGCDHRCTFCIIPFARGNNRSLAMGAIADQVRALAARRTEAGGASPACVAAQQPGEPTAPFVPRRRPPGDDLRLRAGERDVGEPHVVGGRLLPTPTADRGPLAAAALAAAKLGLIPRVVRRLLPREQPHLRVRFQLAPRIRREQIVGGRHVGRRLSCVAAKLRPPPWQGGFACCGRAVGGCPGRIGCLRRRAGKGGPARKASLRWRGAFLLGTR